LTDAASKVNGLSAVWPQARQAIPTSKQFPTADGSIVIDISFSAMTAIRRAPASMPKYRMRTMKQSVPKSVDEYIAAQPEAVRPKLEQVRAAIRRAVPEAVEGIGYHMVGYKVHGKPMLYFAGFKEHYSLFAASGTFFAALEEELRGYELRKGTVHFPLTKPVPVKLIARIAKLRAAGIAATANKPLLGREKERRK
jgi:uncharacterized protein YdhG (YjbR/CyaY superfamily)